MRILLILLMVISCGKKQSFEVSELNNPNSDSDMDGVSNINEAQAGTDPFVNENFVTNYLGDNLTRIKVKLRGNKDFSENINFLSHKLSKKYFYEKELMEKIYSPLYKKKLSLDTTEKEINKKALMMNVYSCVSNMQLNSLKVKFGESNITQTDIFTNLINYDDFKNTRFYIYDFENLDEIYFYNENQEEYKSYGQRMSDSAFKNGFCILYHGFSPKEMQKFNQLSKVIKIKSTNFDQESPIDFFLYSSKVYSNQSLIKRLNLVNFDSHDIFYYKNKIENKFKQEQRVDIKNNSILQNLKVGDSIKVYNYIKSNIRNNAIFAGNLRGRSCNRNGERAGRCRVDNSGACKAYYKPKVTSVQSYYDLDSDLSNYSLTVGNKRLSPSYIINFLAVYEFEITESMLDNGRAKFSFNSSSSKTYTFESVYYSVTSRSRSGYRYSCDQNVNKASVSKNVMDYNHKITIVRRGDYR